MLSAVFMLTFSSLTMPPAISKKESMATIRIPSLQVPRSGFPRSDVFF